jgi:hypothetical protein
MNYFVSNSKQVFHFSVKKSLIKKKKKMRRNVILPRDQQNDDVAPLSSSSPSSTSTSTKRFDHIVAARRRYGAKVNLSGLGPGNERVVAAELFLIEAAGGASAVYDVTRASIPFPVLYAYNTEPTTSNNKSESSGDLLQLENNNNNSNNSKTVQQKVREPSDLDRAAWQVLNDYRYLWIESWDESDRIRQAEINERKKIYSLAHESLEKASRTRKIQAAAWVLIDRVESDVRAQLEHEEDLVFEGLMHFFRGKRNELEIQRNLGYRESKNFDENVLLAERSNAREFTRSGRRYP